MQKLQNYHLTMHLATQVVLNENESKFSSFTAYPNVKESFDNFISTEQSLAAEQELRKRKSAATKQSVKDAAGEYVLDLSRKISAYATITSNNALLERARFDVRTIMRSNDNNLVQIFESLLNCANEFLESVTEYGVTEQMLSDGADLLANLKSEMQNLMLIRAEQKQLTAQLQQQFKTTDAELGNIDAMVETMRLSDPVIYRLYQNARRKQKSASSKLSLLGKVIDADTQQPLPKARITIQSCDTSKTLSAGSDLARNVKIAGPQGGFHNKNMQTGSYLLKVSYAGHADQEITVHVNEGILSRVEIPLTRLSS